MIEARNVRYSVSTGSASRSILNGIDLEIRNGEFVCLLGPSGCGKTTLLNMIGGLIRPGSGSIRVAGEAVSELRGGALRRFRREKVAFVFQFHNLLPTLTVEENVLIGLQGLRLKPKECNERVRKYLDAVGMRGKSSSFPSEMSGGEQQRAAIARALARRPGVILADEPTGNLDGANGTAVLDTLIEMRREYAPTILLITHDQGIANRSDRIIKMRDGLIEGPSR